MSLPGVRHGRWPAVVALALVMASCSEKSSSPSSDPALRSHSQLASTDRQFPPGAAAPLSIMAPSTEVASDPFAAAVECAAALQVTAKMVSQLPQVSETEQASLRQAHEAFRARANRLADNTPAPKAIAAKVRQVQGDPTAQVRLAMNCLQRS
jgi:hypothetical protein